MSSRVGVFSLHGGDLLRLRRCPICQWAIDQDHAEALAMHTERISKPSHLTEGIALERDAQQPAVVTGFALV
jgi:hypothetical protein